MYGISIYPYKEKEEETLRYIDKASECNFKRVFTNLLALPMADKDSILATMRRAIARCRKHNMEVIIDVNPALFEQLGIAYSNLSFFKEMGATAIRLDQTFDGATESLLSFEPSGVDIELNISQDSAYVENILSFAPNRKRLIGCHNFYPQRYTALDYNFFVQCSKRYRALGLRTAAFINSPSATHGPHIFSDGLCTLEMHRDKSLLTQAKHYVAMNEWVDDIIIANAFASDAELESLAALPQEQLYLDVELMPHTSPLELEVLLNNQHFNRGDINSYSHRSTQVRVKYKEGDFPAHDTIPTLQRGDVTLGNNNFGQYKGELGLVKAAMPNNGAYKNVVARVVQEELFLLDYIKPNTKWRFRVKN